MGRHNRNASNFSTGKSEQNGSGVSERQEQTRVRSSVGVAAKTDGATHVNLRNATSKHPGDATTKQDRPIVGKKGRQSTGTSPR